MSKKCYRFFGGLLNTQEKWLNKMSEKGYRLVRTGKLLYEFEKCKPDEVTYCVEFIGKKSKESSIDYANFLEDMGYKVFFKNINLNYSVGKVRWRPWAERGGRIATNTTTFNREILIVEKANDGKPFELHTSYDDKEKYYPYVWGGSSPSTSFDCSGFVSYVINHCGNGWSVGRLTANGLMGVCDIIPKSSAKPGDLIFFQGTYDTSGASHVGIYVGNGMMIHCGNPISYASIESNYWQQHFYCFGRIRN